MFIINLIEGLTRLFVNKMSFDPCFVLVKIAKI